MTKLLFPIIGASLLGLLAQAAPPVDFDRDVRPILRNNCIGCHGPSAQSRGLRVDRRSSATRDRRVVPGGSENSLIYRRISGTEAGPQMPPTGAMKPELIATIKNWIDQGAHWPDALANEVELPPLDPAAVSLVESLRTGDLTSFMKAVTADPKLLNARGPGGATPFMYAVLYAKASTLTQLLDLGADPNAANDVKATALLWAAPNLEKTRLLLDHHANVNARSDDLRTPLMSAARKPGNIATVKLLLDHGANLNPNRRPESESSPLLEAVTAGDVDIIKLLLARGADAKAAGQTGLTTAAFTCGYSCFEMLAAKVTDPEAITGSLQDVAVLGDLKTVQYLLDHGADVKAFDPTGRTALMYAAASDLLPLDVVKLLVAKGADLNATSQHKLSGDSGLSILDMAKLHGQTPIVDFLLQAGAKSTNPASPKLTARHDNTIHAAVQDSLPLLQRSDVAFATKSGCMSCHNNSIVAMTVSQARQRGFQINETAAVQEVKANAAQMAKNREKFYQNYLFTVGDNFGTNSIGYLLIGLAAEGYQPDLNTDAVAMYILNHQSPDGQWAYPIADTRPPLCSDHIGQTAISLRALQLYAPATGRADADQAITLASNWLAKEKPLNTDDMGWRLIGLAWAAKDKAATKQALKELLAIQRPDGGWSDLPSMPTSAYATGKALVALHTAGLATSSPAYQRGIKYLLSTQQPDGSWFVKTRAQGFQPHFDGEFPYEFDQWISTAGSAWSALALTLAEPAKPTTAARDR